MLDDKLEELRSDKGATLRESTAGYRNPRDMVDPILASILERVIRKRS
jgi:hypothetical protein